MAYRAEHDDGDVAHHELDRVRVDAAQGDGCRPRVVYGVHVRPQPRIAVHELVGRVKGQLGHRHRDDEVDGDGEDRRQRAAEQPRDHRREDARLEEHDRAQHEGLVEDGEGGGLGELGQRQHKLGLDFKRQQSPWADQVERDEGRTDSPVRGDEGAEYPADHEGRGVGRVEEEFPAGLEARGGDGGERQRQRERD